MFEEGVRRGRATGPIGRSSGATEAPNARSASEGRESAARLALTRHLPPAATLAAALSLAAAAEAERPSVVLFGGILTDNVWEEVVLTPWRIAPERPGLAGLGMTLPLGRPVDTIAGEVRFEVEPQIVRHFGLQRHWEFNLPVTARLRPETPVLGVIDAVAFGIGPSYATRPPGLEERRGDGDVSQTLIYWHLELERGLSADSSLFLRLHHRSDGFGTIGPGGSSNGLVIGLRRGF